MTAAIDIGRTGRKAGRDRRGTRRAAPACLVALAAAVSAATAATAPADGRDVRLTLYRQDVGLVQDRRALEMRGREDTVDWPAVAPSLQLDTVRFAADGLALRGYRLRNRPLTLQAMLEAYVGRAVRVRRAAGAAGPSLVAARLVSADPPMVSTSEGLEHVDPMQVVFPTGVPAGLGDDPALKFDVTGAGGGPATVTYLADGLGWDADYVVVLSPDGGTLDLEARVRLHNDTRAAFPDARIDLVAGVLSVPRASPHPLQARTAEAGMAAADHGTAPRSLDQYYRYALPRRITLPPGSSRDVVLFHRGGIAVARTRVLSDGPGAFLRREAGSGWEPVALETRLAWTVEGDPLPGGLVRVYARDAGGTLRFLGGERIQDRPAGTRAVVTPGRPFDLTARRRQTAYRRLDDHTDEVAHEIRIDNAGDEAARVRVEEHIPGDWRITRASHEWSRESAQLAVWMLDVPAGDSIRLTYQARISH